MSLTDSVVSAILDGSAIAEMLQRATQLASKADESNQTPENEMTAGWEIYVKNHFDQIALMGCVLIIITANASTAGEVSSVTCR